MHKNRIQDSDLNTSFRAPRARINYFRLLAYTYIWIRDSPLQITPY